MRRPLQKRPPRPRKPGAYARRQERARYRELLAVTWPILVPFVIIWYALFIGLHVWAARFGDVVFGVTLTIPPWLISIFLLSDVGAATWSRGADAEQWTSAALRKALDREYVILNDIQFERQNIDHVVIGPSGLFVVETKWSSTPWRSYRGDLRLRQARKQATHYARDLQRRLEGQGVTIAPEPLVVLWGGRTRSWAPDTRMRVVDRVTVLAGYGVPDWAARLPAGMLTPAQCDDLARRLPRIAAG